MTSSNSRCATFTNEADGYVYHRSPFSPFSTLSLDMFHRRAPLASFSRPKVQLYVTVIIFLLLLGPQTSSTMADLKDWLLPMLKPKLPCKSRSWRRPIWLQLRLSTWHFLEQIRNHCLFCFLVSSKLTALVPLLAISLKLRGSTKFSSHPMDLRTLSLLALPSLVLATPKPYQGWLV
jgi:hypothetical protein